MVLTLPWILALLLPALVDANPSPPRTPGIASDVCARAPAPQFAVTAPAGFRAGPVLGGLTLPRGITLDVRGNILVVERGKGVTGHFVDSNGCVTRSRVVIADTTLNHGIDLNAAGTRLFASSNTTVWSWDYNPFTVSASNKRVIVRGMTASRLVTRTVVLSKENPNFLIVSIGANDNVDRGTIDAASGRSQIRAFDLRRIPTGGAVFGSSTTNIIGYGIRNGVAVTEDKSGIVHVVDNSLDGAFRLIDGRQVDIQQDNPAEGIFKLSTPTNPGKVFTGAPFCYPTWNTSAIPNSANMRVGDWFSIEPETDFGDSYCATNARRPVSLLPPHTSPLDIKFGVGSRDASLFVTLHGSSGRTPLQGFKVVRVAGRNTRDGWVPTADPTSTAAFTDFLSNVQTECSLGCFRPVGLVWSRNGRFLYVTSDTTGEVFLVRQN